MSTRVSSPIAAPAIPRSAPRPLPTTSSTFGDLVARARTPNPSPPATAPAASSPARPTLLGDVSRQLIGRVARGERYMESVVRQGLSGRAFTPNDLLAMQAQVYRYTQELELVSKLVDRGTNTVKTVLQQGG